MNILKHRISKTLMNIIEAGVLILCSACLIPNGYVYALLTYMVVIDSYIRCGAVPDRLGTLNGS